MIVKVETGAWYVGGLTGMGEVRLTGRGRADLCRRPAGMAEQIRPSLGGTVTEQTASALPPVVDQQAWQAALDELRVREKAATRELDAIAAQRRRLPMVELPDYTLVGSDGPIRLVDVFDERSQLIVYNHMWSDGAEWQCGGCTAVSYTHLTLPTN